MEYQKNINFFYTSDGTAIYQQLHFVQKKIII